MRYLTLLTVVATLAGCECSQGARSDGPTDHEPAASATPVADEPTAEEPPPSEASLPPGASRYEWTRVQWLAREVNVAFDLRDETDRPFTWHAETTRSDVSTLVITMRPEPTTAATLSAVSDPAERARRFASMRDAEARQIIERMRTVTENHDMSDWAVAAIHCEPPPGLPDEWARVRIRDWPALRAADGFAGLLWGADSANVPLTEP